MASGTQAQRTDNQETYVRILGNRQARVTLHQLIEYGPFSERTLARRLTATRRAQLRSHTELSQWATSSECSQSDVLIQLRHRYLPMLEKVGWINRCSSRVAIDTEFSTEPLGIRTAALRNPDDPAWEPTAALLGNPYLKSIVEIISTTDLPYTLRELVWELETRGETGYHRRNLQARLHHVALPKLDDLDVLSYSAERRVITRCGPVTPFQLQGVARDDTQA